MKLEKERLPSSFEKTIISVSLPFPPVVPADTVM